MSLRRGDGQDVLDPNILRTDDNSFPIAVSRMLSDSDVVGLGPRAILTNVNRKDHCETANEL